MSLRYRDSSGNETIVSGLTPGGDIEAGAMAERSGTFNISVGAGSYAAYTITFDEPMPDDDYIVSFYAPSTSQGMQYLFFNSDQQTANGFIAMVNNTYNTAISRTGIRYKAIKTYSVQHAAQNAEDIANIKAVIPSAASSTNQLTPKKYVDDADTALDGRVSDLEDLIPTDASVTNQLTSKSYVDNAIQHVEIDVDAALDSESENPVQNKVVKAAIDTKQDKVFVGTVSEWETLTQTEQNKYQLVNLTDDGETGGEQNYLTTEQKTGDKWIDGKDIYKLSYVLDNPVGSTTVNKDLSAYNIDTIIKWDAIVGWGQGSGSSTIAYWFPYDVTVTSGNFNYSRQYYTRPTKMAGSEKASAYAQYRVYNINTIYYTKA